MRGAADERVDDDLGGGAVSPRSHVVVFVIG
jgi:hypothetical protein